jgi:hypothetical protein
MSRWEAVKDVPRLRELYYACLTAASARLLALYATSGSGYVGHVTTTDQGANAVVELADQIYDSVIGQQ